MRLARAVGLDVAEHGLIELLDGTIAYLTWRFDRVGRGGARTPSSTSASREPPPEDKESSTTEECGRLARQYATPETAAALFQLFVFAYWVRNGDLHLKNLMLMRRPDGAYSLAPAYDLLCTEPYNQKGMTPPVGGERVNIARPAWLAAAAGSSAWIPCRPPRSWTRS